MDRFVIRGGVPLHGSVRVSGSKNSVLALMAASLLTEEPLILQNAARVRDVSTMMRILGALGIDASWEADDVLRVAGGTPSAIEAPYDLVRTQRASFMVLGPLLAR